jgi:autonomous glycyl radical cofactor GrcA
MKRILISVIILVSGYYMEAQGLYSTKNGQISFFSKTSMENIDAVNNEVNSLFNSPTGDIVFQVLVKGFHFQRALMEEHFNENYLESDKYPKATFKGKIANYEGINFSKDGTYPVSVQGDLTIHNVTQKVTAPGTITIKGGKPEAVSKFTIRLSDYAIKIPSLVADKIAETMDISVDCKYEPKQ